ncbi:MAG: hypothetical protein QOJ27_2957 [Sphingomonadales bacterium]|nr:hypothetical protein [Sphingomonadales bacterium]
MPRYFFHVFEDALMLDDEGIDLADAEAARAAALAGARSMMCDEVRSGRLTLHHRVDVEDENGAPILSLAFGDAVTIEP